LTVEPRSDMCLGAHVWSSQPADISGASIRSVYEPYGALHQRGCSWGLKPPLSSRNVAMYLVSLREAESRDAQVLEAVIDRLRWSVARA
jgi:hypothetical protein